MNFRGLIVVFAFALLARAAFAGDSFAAANQEFSSGNFAGAIELYQKSLQEDGFHAATFYNLGNAHFRADDLGRAILNYERALALQPHHPEAEANLRLARDKARALELKPAMAERLINSMTATQFTGMAAVGFWIAAFGWAAWFLARRRSNGLVAIALIFALVFIGSSVAAYLRETGTSGSALAIVVAKGTDARLATADNAQTVLTLPAGSEIKILQTRGDWSYAELPNALRGWIPAQNAERVRL